MLAELTPLDEVVYLVRDSGIQFMDFGVSLQPKKMEAGAFVRMGATGVARLLTNHKTGGLFSLGAVGDQAADTSALVHEDRTVTSVRTPHFDLPMDESLKLLGGVWLPMPYFRFTPPHRFDPGPTNWARMRLVALDEPDLAGNNYRLTIAFDTKPLEGNAKTTYLAPSPDDVQSKAQFRVACHSFQLRWFLDQKWMRSWLEELFRDAHRELRTDHDEIEDSLRQHHHLAHYLNVLSLLAEPEAEEYAPAELKALVQVPGIYLTSGAFDESGKQRDTAIPVDLILDVGNSRTCGILIENQGMTGNGLKQNYVLQMRDLHDPERLYREPFASRVEFAHMTFGKENFSKLSGRHDAFQWATIARVGTEASRLCARRRGSEGSTGMSSPKRYLWDDSAYKPGWRFSSAFGKAQGTEAMATAAPFTNFITDEGVVFYGLDAGERDYAMPAFSPNYSRSSLMSIMLAEVITQALSQINSAAQRTRMGHASTPRFLSSITMTVPPGLPEIERSILQERLKHAVSLVWLCMGWTAGDGYSDPFEPAPEGQAPKRPPLSVRVQWDEAVCGQLVYLYTEVCENFKGNPEEFFDVLARPDKAQRDGITLATMDIGGGTTDLVINDYHLLKDGVNRIIVPTQRFRDSFKVAGDDVLLDVIQKEVLPALKAALEQAGVRNGDALLSKLCGDEAVSAQAGVLRQQLNLQVFVPVGLAVLRAYEQFNPEFPSEPLTQCFGQWMGESVVSPAVQAYVLDAVKLEAGFGAAFDVAAVPLTLDLARMHKHIVEGRYNICKVLDSLCEIIGHYPCDALLLTGRPSMLPGVQAYLRRKMVVPPGRITPMHGYTTNGWYPFHKGGKINDPKTTAVVGAMLCLLSEKAKLFDFAFNVARLRPYSTMRHIGVIDKDNIMSDARVLFRDVIKFEDGKEKLDLGADDGEDDESGGQVLSISTSTRLGFKQLEAERWMASPLYVLEFTESGADKLKAYAEKGEGVPSVQVRLAAPSRREVGALSVSERLQIRAVKGGGLSKFDVQLKLFTMNGTDSGASTYWIDSGSVK